MTYKETSGQNRHEFTLLEKHVSIIHKPFMGHHAEINVEYGAISTTASKVAMRRAAFSPCLLMGVLFLLIVVIGLFDKVGHVRVAVSCVFGSLSAISLFVAFLSRKRLPYLLFHNHEGQTLFQVGGDSPEFDQFTSELQRRIGKLH